MTRLLPCLLPLSLLAACNTTTTGFPTSSGGGAMAERLVIGGAMSFEDCRAQGGLIIRDQGSPVLLCDPTVLGPVVPADEFDHPAA